MEQQRQYVGIDLHRRRSVFVRMAPDGTVLERSRVENSPLGFAAEIAKAGPNPEVVLEATLGWYWAADVLADNGASVHLAHPLGVKAFAYQRVKKDDSDAQLLADLLRMGRLPEAWIAPPPLRELREMVRHRHGLVEARADAKLQVHAVLAKQGVVVVLSDLFGVAGNRLLDELHLDPAYQARVESLRRVVALHDQEIAALDAAIHRRLAGDAAYQALQTIPGVGRVLAAVFVAEIGDIGRFQGPEQLASWAGMTPRHHESDTTIRRGRITKQGSRLVRWAAIEAAVGPRGPGFLKADYRRLAARRGKMIAKVAAGRKLLTLVFYGMRDGEIRCLAEEAA
ncbi:MAG TPA: IS110 family transposase [Chloroflexota bacterium]|nr:IS110 family transposase [Chloroflexota bacterium]